jgi:hypothetical protein
VNLEQDVNLENDVNLEKDVNLEGVVNLEKVDQQDSITTLAMPVRRSARIATKQALSYKTMVEKRHNDRTLGLLIEIDTFYKTHKREPTLTSENVHEKNLAAYIKNLRSLPNTANVEKLVNRYLPWFKVTEPVAKPPTKFSNLFMGLLGVSSLLAVIVYSLGQPFMVTALRYKLPVFYSSLPGVNYLAF